MRVYISADIEGVTGVSKWQETIKGGADYEYYRAQMTKEVIAACEGARAAGATQIVVKDAHDDGKNLIANKLPEDVQLLSGWRNHPYNMIEGIEGGFDAVIFIGYHSGAYSNGSPLSHTLHPKQIRSMHINGQMASEFLIHTYAAYSLGIPVVAISGDQKLMEAVKGFNTHISTISVQEGIGDGIVSIHPEEAIRRIKEGVQQALKGMGNSKWESPDHYELEVEFNQHSDAYKFGFYPGAYPMDDYRVGYQSKDYLDLLRFLLFLS